MFVSATTGCFPTETLESAAEKLSELDFSALEIFLHESDGCIKPSELVKNFETTVKRCRDLRRMNVAVYSIDTGDCPDFALKFQACCKMAKLNRVVTLVLRSSELGTPYNEEVERLKLAVQYATYYGCVVGILPEKGRMSEDLATVRNWCEKIRGLGIALDPAYYVGPVLQSSLWENLIPYVYHVRLRECKEGAFQVKVGQGDIEYGKLLSQLEKVGYKRSLSIDIVPNAVDDHAVELRKMRLLIESLL